MGKNWLNVLVVLALILGIGACAAFYSMPPEEKARLQQRTYEANYEDTFKAARTVLEDEGFAFATIDNENGILITEPREPDIKSTAKIIMNIWSEVSPIKWNISVKDRGGKTSVIARLFTVPEKGPAHEVLKGRHKAKYEEFFKELEVRLGR